MNAIYTWMLLTAAFLVIEALTAPIWLQAVAFAAVSLILLLITRPLAVKYMKKGRGATSLDRMIGKEVLVTEQIDNLRGTGEVQLDGQFWMARSVNSDQIIEKGEVAMVRDIQGVKLIVGKRIA